MVGFFNFSNYVLCGGQSFGKVHCLPGFFGEGSFSKINTCVLCGFFSRFVLQAVIFWQSRFAGIVGKVFLFMGFVPRKSFRFLVVVLGSLFFVMAFVFQVRFIACLKSYFAFIMAAGLTAAEQ